MAEYQEKFLVLNLKHLEELTDETRTVFEDACERVRDELKLDNKYYVCNQDEPYAGDVINIILSGEDKKAAKKLGIEDSKNSSLSPNNTTKAEIAFLESLLSVGEGETFDIVNSLVNSKIRERISQLSAIC